MKMYVSLIRRHFGSSIACLKSLSLGFRRRSSCRSKCRVQVLVFVLPKPGQARVLLNNLGTNLQLQYLPVIGWTVIFHLLAIRCEACAPVLGIRAVAHVLSTITEVRALLRHPVTSRYLQQLALISAKGVLLEFLRGRFIPGNSIPGKIVRS